MPTSLDLLKLDISKQIGTLRRKNPELDKKLKEAEKLGEKR